MTQHDILSALEFNAVYCGDPGARIYFGHAAECIRTFERECMRLRRRLLFERAQMHSVEIETMALESALSIIIDREDA